MSDLTGIDWEDAYSNADHIHKGSEFPGQWAQAAEAFRAHTRGKLDIAYGEAPRERLDLFLPDQPALGLVVFIHGGFWLKFDKSFWSHLAAGALSHRWAVVMPSYTLAPQARIGSITSQIGRAVTLAAGLVHGPIRLAGHSAGGHLATRLVCDDSTLPDEVSSRLDRIVSISGLHDLRPLQLHSMNTSLRLDPAEAAAESPVLHRRRHGVDITAWVGAAERPEFLRQSAVLAEAWDAPLMVEPNRHHFNVIDGLADPSHPLTRRLVVNS